MRKLVLFAFSLAFAGAANAALTTVSDLTIDSYRVTYDSGYVFFTVKVKEDITGTGCAITDNNNEFSYWVASNSNALQQILHATAVAADAQERKIDIVYESTLCSGIGGRQMYGINVHPAPVQP